MAQNTKYLELDTFLSNGALLRTPDGRLYCWQDLQFLDKGQGFSADFSLAYQEFFASTLQPFHGLGPFTSSVGSFRAKLASFLQQQLQPALPLLKKQDFVAADKGKFEKSFQEIQGKIHRGEIEKAVPVIFAQASKTVTKADLVSMMFHALEADDGLFVYGVWNSDFGILGATPESLFQQKDGLIKTMALAGTCPKSEVSKRPNLLKDAKELHEHNLVVRDIQDRLQKQGTVRTSPTKIVEFPTLLHLKTEIEVNGPQVPLDVLTKQLHPTAALGVAPRNYGIQWLAELPYQKQRGFFGAPIVFRLTATEDLAVVAIRNIQWSPQACQIGAGCGLVNSSELDREWNELGAKVNTVFKILGLDK